MEVTIGPKYQIVIPKKVRKNMRGIHPGMKVTVIQVDNQTVKVRVEPQSWVERTAGMMTDAWKDIDPIKELEKGRDEWEERLKKLGK